MLVAARAARFHGKLGFQGLNVLQELFNPTCRRGLGVSRALPRSQLRNVPAAGFGNEIGEADAVWTGKFWDKMNKSFVLQIKRHKNPRLG